MTAIYTLIEPFFAPNDTLIAAGSRIAFDGMPNLSMAPENEEARVRWQAYVDELNAQATAAAKAQGKSYAGNPRQMEDAVELARPENRHIQTEPNGPGIPLMGGKRRGRPPRVELLESTPADNRPVFRVDADE